MSILVKFYGRLREHIDEIDLGVGLPVSYKIEPKLIHSVNDILEKFSISENELSHIFVNGEYSGVEKDVNPGDRVGLFPKNMALIFVEILSQNR